MPPIPPIAPMMDDEAAEGEAPTSPLGGANKVSIQCAAKDCKYNNGGQCTKDSINVSAGPEVKCESYEPGAKAPAPPMPPMGMGGM